MTADNFTLVQYELFIILKMVGLHSNYIPIYFLIMSHTHDVINLNGNKGVQKPFAECHFAMTQKICISIIILGFSSIDVDVLRIGFHRTLSEGQEIDRKSKFFADCH